MYELRCREQMLRRIGTRNSNVARTVFSPPLIASVLYVGKQPKTSNRRTPRVPSLVLRQQVVSMRTRSLLVSEQQAAAKHKANGDEKNVAELANGDWGAGLAR